jgi:hypothetical protein
MGHRKNEFNSRTTKRLSILVGVLLISGCASNPQVKLSSTFSPKAGGAISATVHEKDKQITIFSTENQTALAAASAAGAIPIFGLLGAIVVGGTIGATAELAKNARLGFTSEQLAKEHSLEDPKLKIEKILIGEIAKQFQLELAEVPMKMTKSGPSLEEIVQQHPTTPYIVDITTTKLMIKELGSEKFQFQYAAKMMFIDTKSGQLLASGNCKYESPTATIDLKKLQDKTIDQLQSEITLAVDSCVHTLRGNSLGV